MQHYDRPAKNLTLGEGERALRLDTKRSTLRYPRTAQRILRSAAASGLLSACAVLLPALPASAVSSGNGVSTSYGFDTCPMPSTSDMQTMWYNSPDFWYNVYIGGSNGLCQPGSIPGWLNTVQAQGWVFEYTDVGLQPPCTNFTNRFSSDPSTAYSEGQGMASGFLNQLIDDGVSPAGNSTPVIYDLESAGNGTCQAAINAFVSGYVSWVLTAGYIPGVYGSICGSNLAALAGASNVPYFIWGADSDNNPNTAVLNDGPGGCGVPSSYWTSNQRLKQYSSSGAGTYYGVSFPGGIDYDCADSWTTPYGYAGNCN